MKTIVVYTLKLNNKPMTRSLLVLRVILIAENNETVLSFSAIVMANNTGIQATGNCPGQTRYSSFIGPL